METVRKHRLETVSVPYDFSGYLNSVGNPVATYSETLDIGLGLVDSVLTDQVVTLTLSGGADNTDYLASVTATTDSGGVTITKRILVESAIPPALLSLYADSYADNYA